MRGWVLALICRGQCWRFQVHEVGKAHGLCSMGAEPLRWSCIARVSSNRPPYPPPPARAQSSSKLSVLWNEKIIPEQSFILGGAHMGNGHLYGAHGGSARWHRTTTTRAKGKYSRLEAPAAPWRHAVEMCYSRRLISQVKGQVLSRRHVMCSPASGQHCPCSILIRHKLAGGSEGRGWQLCI